MAFPRHLRRRLALAPILLAHAAVLAVVMLEPGSGIRRPAPTRSLAVFAVEQPAAPPAPRPVARTRPAPAIAPMLPLQPAAPEALADPAPLPALSETSLAPGEVCDLSGRLQVALRGDPMVRAALGMLPRDARSVANAVMLWDGRWVAGTTTATRYALDRIRTAVLETVAAAPASCRAEAQAGPVLMTLAGSPDTVLALGSGRWRWIDMFGQPATELAASSAVALRASTTPPAT